MMNLIKNYRSLLFIALFFAILTVVFNLLFTLEDINRISQSVQEQRASQPILVIILFCTVYIVSTALSLPLASVLTVAAGAIFDTTLGSVLVIFSATTGSIPPHLFVKHRLGESILKKYPSATKLKSELDNSGELYLLAARIAPVFPFYVVNAVSGLSKISLIRYILITAVGIAPGTVTYVFAGSQIEQAIETGTLVSPGTILGLFILSLFSLASALLQRRLKP